jgi:hypothetical protein
MALPLLRNLSIEPDLSSNLVLSHGRIPYLSALLWVTSIHGSTTDFTR